MSDITEERIQEIEETVVRMDAILGKLVSKTQWKQLNLVFQQELDDVKAELESLKSRVEVLETRL